MESLWIPAFGLLTWSLIVATLQPCFRWIEDCLAPDLPGGIGTMIALVEALWPGLLTDHRQFTIGLTGFVLIWFLISYFSNTRREREHSERTEAQKKEAAEKADRAQAELRQSQDAILLAIENKIPTPQANLIYELVRLADEIEDFLASEEERLLRESWQGQGLTPPIESLSPEQRQLLYASLDRVQRETLDKFREDYQPRIIAFLKKIRDMNLPDTELERLTAAPPTANVEIFSLAYLLRLAVTGLAQKQAA